MGIFNDLFASYEEELMEGTFKDALTQKEEEYYEKKFEALKRKEPVIMNAIDLMIDVFDSGEFKSTRPSEMNDSQIGMFLHYNKGIKKGVLKYQNKILNSKIPLLDNTYANYIKFTMNLDEFEASRVIGIFQKVFMFGIMVPGLRG